MRFPETFDWKGRRFPAARARRGGTHTLRILILTPRPEPYRGDVHGLEATTVGGSTAECDRLMRKWLATQKADAWIEEAYAGAGSDNRYVDTRRSGVAGRGVFARRAIARGAVVEDVTRPLVPYALVPKKGERGYGHAIQIARGFWLRLTHSRFYYLNHSCAPNVRLSMSGALVKVVARRAIARGEELTLDYGTVAFRDDPYAIVCRCGAPRCRGIVRGLRPASRPQRARGKTRSARSPR